jgi:hypothetical protein
MESWFLKGGWIEEELRGSGARWLLVCVWVGRDVEAGEGKSDFWEKTEDRLKGAPSSAKLRPPLLGFWVFGRALGKLRETRLLGGLRDLWMV